MSDYEEEWSELVKENARLRAALRCERETGVCVAVHNPDRPHCDKTNCRYVDNEQELKMEGK